MDWSRAAIRLEFILMIRMRHLSQTKLKLTLRTAAMAEVHRNQMMKMFQNRMEKILRSNKSGGGQRNEYIK